VNWWSADIPVFDPKQQWKGTNMINTNGTGAPATIRFPLGQVVSTPGALEAMAHAGQDGSQLLARHHSGDWGEVCDSDKLANDQAVETGERILSAYTLITGTKVWIITEADRSSTCILLPDEY
jgi:hypothetical protein